MSKARSELFEGPGLKMDMSPMIDLVFLLLIFFMISSTLITYKKDKNVKIPIASAGKVPKLVTGRVIINVYQDGTLKDESGKKTLTPEQVEVLMRNAKAKNPETRLHIRADKGAAHKHVKEVVAASARGGVIKVIYSTYVTGKGN